MKVLIMTVGGEDKPLVESILQNEPGWIYFICSAGQNSSRVMVEKDGLVCGRGTKPNILTQTGFPRDKYAILEVDPDDPTDVYKEAKGIMVKHMGDSILADYTGGTKSMASGLLLAALEFDHCQPILMKGPRADLIKVTGDASVPTEINRYNITVSRYLKAFEDLLARQDYGGAREIIRKILRIKDKADLEDHEKEFLGKANLAMLAFDRWDRFEYAEAWEDLVIYNRTYKKTISPEMKACKDRAFKLAGLVNWLKNENSGEDHRDQRQPGKADGHGTVSFNIRNPKKKCRCRSTISFATPNGEPGWNSTMTPWPDCTGRPNCSRNFRSDGSAYPPRTSPRTRCPVCRKSIAGDWRRSGMTAAS